MTDDPLPVPPSRRHAHDAQFLAAGEANPNRPPSPSEAEATDLLIRLRSRNVLRCQRDFHHDIESWSVLEWAGAMSGEAGEATNFAKKITRGDFAATDILTRKGVTLTAAEHLADEVADTLIYADLLCARVGVSLMEAIVRKFNATSDERGSDIRL